ncbi:hypothetical protein CC1G_15240 [Coprinopsis cinerea okayama7|uniref:Uncharacterized protein n=1 Tax=Coprinopsis cinerea (strain Okayama-7 / 130 / ATCC MYA-4618 / FGSC 9003) TaxID=240176 RepID=D6RQ65_COPC7|nr:hypothetical protein CC1G_15240 [Coprinopsis cinerea okayama7\|eukprot:XP_002910332.1 hypothetical protein CC1G_15240 [Coprinopsis cinerea okayama7\
METETGVHSQHPVGIPLPVKKIVIDVFGADKIGKSNLCEGIACGPPFDYDWDYDPTIDVNPHGWRRYLKVQNPPTEPGNDAETSVEAEWLCLELNPISSRELVSALERIS